MRTELRMSPESDVSVSNKKVGMAYSALVAMWLADFTQLGATLQVSRIPYENEAAADCLAGAFTQQTARDGSLEDGDLEEAFFGLAAAGDPTPDFTGHRETDVRIPRRAALMGHGTRDQRMANFKSGYDGGAKACLAVFR